jgi:hypothetical protein
MIRITSAALAAGALLAALPASGQAATTFGSRLLNEPANGGDCMQLTTPCTLASYIHPSDPNGDPDATGAPTDGVITTFRIRAFGEGAPAQVTFRLADVTRPDPNDRDNALATAAGTGPTVTIPEGNGGDVPVLEYPARLAVKRGNHLALDGTNVHATYNSSGEKFTYRFDQPLVDGQGARASNDVTGELLVQAVIEPDLDRDGFGDETQDLCLSSPSSAPPCAPSDLGRDRTKPRVSALKVGRAALSYRLSERAKVSVRIVKKGRTVKRLSASGVPGRNKLAINRRALAPGRYTVVVSARDNAGNTSVVKRIALRVKK